MRSFLFATVIAATVAGGSLDAQAPRITPAGDPSVKADSIYKLAVDPAKYPEYSVAILLDDGVIVAEADGRTRTTYRTIVQILKPDAEENYQEQTFSYAPKHQRMTVNWIRVVKPTGEVVSAEPSQVQDSDVPADEGDPVYSDRKVRRASLTGVKAGTIVDYSYTTEELKPFLEGDFFFNWRVNPGVPVRRSRYIVDMPASLTPRIHEVNLDFARRTVTSGGRTVYTWARNDVAPIKAEALAGDSNSVAMGIYISAPVTWTGIGAWYAANARGRYALTPAVVKAIHEQVANARTLDDSIRAVHRWVAQDIRYVSIALGLGGYQPRTPDEVVRTGFGDCKDKATLFIAALSSFGVTAEPVILNSSGVPYRTLPSIEQLDHLIAAVRRDGRTQYVDLTADLVPYGELPSGYEGSLGLLVHADGKTEEITFPKPPRTANANVVRLTGTLSDGGEFNGAYVEEATGARGVALRSNFRHPLDSTTKADAATSVARNFFEYADGDSLEAFDGKDLAATPRYRVRIRHGKAAEPAGDNLILRLPFRPMGSMNNAASELEKAPPRRFTIDPEKFWGNSVARSEFRVTLPAGWRAKLPPNVSAASAFGSYTSEYLQDGSELIVRRTMEGQSGLQPPEAVKDLITWLRAVGRDDARMIVLERASALQASKP